MSPWRLILASVDASIARDADRSAWARPSWIGSWTSSLAVRQRHGLSRRPAPGSSEGPIATRWSGTCAAPPFPVRGGARRGSSSRRSFRPQPGCGSGRSGRRRGQRDRHDQWRAPGPLLTAGSSFSNTRAAGRRGRGGLAPLAPGGRPPPASRHAFERIPVSDAVSPTWRPARRRACGGHNGR